MDNSTKSDYSIHVRTPSDQTYQKVVDALEPLGVEIVAGETDPLVMAIFYLSRMNTKLDNLGQLKHLYKLLQAANTMRLAAETQQMYYKQLLAERQTRQNASVMYAHDRLVKTGLVKSEDINWTLIAYLSFEEIDRLYKL